MSHEVKATALKSWIGWTNCSRYTSHSYGDCYGTPFIAGPPDNLARQKLDHLVMIYPMKESYNMQPDESRFKVDLLTSQYSSLIPFWSIFAFSRYTNGPTSHPSAMLEPLFMRTGGTNFTSRPI